jgi:adenylate cyclase
MGVNVVGFDVFFPEPDRMNAENVVGSLVGLDTETKQRLLALPSNDKILGDVIRQARRVVVGQAVLPEPKDYKDRKPLPSRVVERAAKGAPPPRQWVPPAPGLLRNVEEIESPAAGHGLVYLLPEADGIVRRVPAFARNENRLFPALSVEMLRIAAGRPGVVAQGNESGIYDVAIDPKLKVPTDRLGRMFPYFSRHDPAKYLSAADVLSGSVDRAKIAGKLALIGTSAQGLLDIKTVPTEAFIPGVEVHAQLIESVLTNQFLSSPNYADTAEMALALIAGIFIIVLVPWIGAKWTLLFFLVVVAGAGGTSWYMFDQQRYLLDASYGITAILILYITMTYMGYASENAQRRATRDAFSKYMSPAVVARVVENPALLSLGGAKRDMTVLFCDVRGFTTISEQFDAVGLTTLINKLLTPLTNVILANKGTVDKYMGDAIMAFWNAPLDDPDHARNGCISALKMVAEMPPLNERLAAEAVAEGRKHVPLKVGLGLNTGDAVVGNMGTAQRMDYSVLGDTINTGSRLEGQSKTYGVDIVLGPETWRRVPDFATIELDIIQVKGKKVGLHVYALMGDTELAKRPDFIKVKATVDAMLAAYRSQKWDEAEALIQELRVIGEPFHLETLCEMYESRIAAYRIEPPPADWDGVFIATSK